MTPTFPNGAPQNGQHAAARTESPAPPTPGPKDALGASGGSLVKASVQAGVGFAVVFAGLTFGPFYWEKAQGDTKVAPAAPEKAPPPTNPTPDRPSPQPGVGPKLPPDAPPSAGKQPGKGDILDKLGEGGTKTAPPKVNPLDKKEDDILKDLNK